jgi:DNA-binding protein H-NS
VIYITFFLTGDLTRLLASRQVLRLHDGMPQTQFRTFRTPGSFFREIEMPTTNLASMSVDTLLKLRDDIGRVLIQKADQLKYQLSRLGTEIDGVRPSRGSAMKGRKAPVKYRDKEGHTWAGRGVRPVWLREKLKAGAKLEDFAVQKTVASRKASPRKAKKRRRKK